MHDSQLKKHIKRMVAGYQAVEKIKEDALSQLSHDAAMEMIQQIFALSVGEISPDRMKSSGLVTMQRYFRGLRP